MRRHVQTTNTEKSLALPAGLDRMRPREVRWTGGGWVLLVSAAALVIGGQAAAIGLGVKALGGRDDVRAFREHAIVTSAVVTRKWRASGDDRPRWVAYEYTVNGRRLPGEARASRALWESLEPGSIIPVRFDDERPERSFAWGREPRTVPAGVPYLAGLAGIASGALLTIPLFRQRRLLAEGRAALATVTQRTKGQHGETVRYEFRTLSGARFTGQTTRASKTPAVGGTLWVIYESEDPRHNSPYPVSLVRLAREAPLVASRRHAHAATSNITIR